MTNQNNLQNNRVSILPVVNEKFGSEITLSQKDIDIVRVIMDLNMILPYPLNDSQLERWAYTINRLRPNWDIEKIAAIVDNFISGHNEWQSNKGISNIFLAETKTTLNF